MQRRQVVLRPHLIDVFPASHQVDGVVQVPGPGGADEAVFARRHVGLHDNAFPSHSAVSSGPRLARDLVALIL